MLIESIAEADEAALVAEELHGEDAGVDKYEWIVDQLENTFDDIDTVRAAFVEEFGTDDEFDFLVNQYLE